MLKLDWQIEEAVWVEWLRRGLIHKHGLLMKKWKAGRWCGPR